MSWRIAAAALALGLGCAHAKQVEAPAEAKPPVQPEQPATHGTHPAPPPPGHPALSASPGGTFEPGAIRQIQTALREAGFAAPESGHLDDATQHQIARFQKDKSMPDTGFPDDATLKRLGLDPEQLHRSTR